MKKNERIGIVLLGGSGTRFYPTTKAINKHLIPIYNKPMFYYPLSVLMIAGIKNYVFVSDKNTLGNIKKILGSGKSIGIKINYEIQNKPLGISDGLLRGIKNFKNNNVTLILGDNFFYGEKLPEILKEVEKSNKSTIITYNIIDDNNFGFLKKINNKLIKIYEKPKKKISNDAVTGLYFYNKEDLELLKNIKPSKRGELEITDFNNLIIKKNSLNDIKLGRGIFWMDCGTPENLNKASEFTKIIEKRMGLQIANLEEISYRFNFISKKKYKKIINLEKNDNQKKYLIKSLKKC